MKMEQSVPSSFYTHLPAYEDGTECSEFILHAPTCPWRWNRVFRFHSTRTYLPMKMGQSVPKRRHINFRRRVITQKKAYKIFLVIL